MTQQWVTGFHLPTSLLSTAMIVNGEPPKCWHWMPLVQCGYSGSLGRNNEKDICTLVLKMGLVIVLAPHIRQTWSYLKLNKIRPTNRLKAKHLWGCSGFSSSLIFNVPVRLNEVIDRRSLVFHSKTLDCQQFCVYSVSSCPNSHWRLPYCTTYFSKKASSMSTCKNLFLRLWGAVGRGDNSRGPRCHVGTRQENLGNIFWSTRPFCIITCPSVWQCSTWIQGSLPTSVSSLIQELVMNRLMFFTCLHKVQLITYTCG